MWVELLIAGYLVPLSQVGDVVWVEDPDEAERVLEAGVARRATKAQIKAHVEAMAGAPIPDDDETETEPNLERLTKAELQELAAEQDLELDPNHMTKAEMIEAIQEAWEQRE